MPKSATTNAEEYKLDDQVGYLLRLAHQRHTAIFQKHTIEQLTPTQFSAIMRISQHGVVSQNHLGRLAGMDVATVKGVVERLKAKDLVEFNADPGDKRRLMISLSTAGKDIVSKLQEIGTSITEESLSPLTSSQRTTFLKLLRILS